MAFVVIADAANQTPHGKLNILGAYNVAFADGFPAQLAGSKLVMRFGYTAVEAGDEHVLMVKLVDQEHNVLGEKSGSITLGEGHGARAFFDLVQDLTPLVFPEPGQYELKVYIDGREEGAAQLTLRETPQGKEETGDED